jgi:xylulokinase
MPGKDMINLILSLDLGTSGIKAALFDEQLNLVASSTRGYETRYGDAGAVTQSAADWWAAAIDAVQVLTNSGTDLSSVAAVGVSGHMMGAVLLDGDGEVIGEALIHADTRAETEAKDLELRLGMDEVYRISGNRPSPSYSGPKMAWIKSHEREAYDCTAVILNPKDFLNFKLTGVRATDRSDASGTLLYDLAARSWSRELIDASGLDRAKLPEIAQSSEVIGTLGAEVAALTGLPQGIPVAAGAGDGMAAGIGAGSVAPGITYNYLGTTSWVATTAGEPIIDPQKRIFTFAHAAGDFFHSMGTMQTAGASLSWAREQLIAEIADDDAAYALIDELAASVPRGSEGVVFLPYLHGERSPWWNNDCTGAWLNLRLNNGRGHMLRAVMEGVATNLALISGALGEFVDIDSIRLLGGGGLSSLWPSILSEAHGRRVELLEESASVTARGAAVLAGIAAGIFPDFSIANTTLAVESEIIPYPEGIEAMANTRKSLINGYRYLNPE